MKAVWGVHGLAFAELLGCPAIDMIAERAQRQYAYCGCALHYASL